MSNPPACRFEGPECSQGGLTHSFLLSDSEGNPQEEFHMCRTHGTGYKRALGLGVIKAPVELTSEEPEPEPEPLPETEAPAEVEPNTSPDAVGTVSTPQTIPPPPYPAHAREAAEHDADVDTEDEPEGTD